MTRAVSVDCDAGRWLGCRTFCCHLLVRLDPGARQPPCDGSTPKGYVDKDENGRCVHLDPETSRCLIWERRPQVCRGYDCNGDFMLQIVLRRGFTNIAAAARESMRAYIPRETFVRVPYLAE